MKITSLVGASLIVGVCMGLSLGVTVMSARVQQTQREMDDLKAADHKLKAADAVLKFANDQLISADANLKKEADELQDADARLRKSCNAIEMEMKEIPLPIDRQQEGGDASMKHDRQPETHRSGRR